MGGRVWCRVAVVVVCTGCGVMLIVCLGIASGVLLFARWLLGCWSVVAMVSQMDVRVFLNGCYSVPSGCQGVARWLQWYLSYSRC